MEPIYRKVFIKSEADLPEDGTYIVHFKNSRPQLVDLNKNSIFSKDNDYWLENIDWYLQTKELPSDEEIEKAGGEYEKEYEASFNMPDSLAPIGGIWANEDFVAGAKWLRDKLINK